MFSSTVDDRKRNRKFGFVTGILLLFIGVYVNFNSTYEIAFVSCGSLILIVAFTVPHLLTPLRLSFEKIGLILGVINTYILLTLVYFLVFLPIGWFLKLLGKDLLDLKSDPKIKTYWKDKNAENSMKLQF